MAYKKARYGIPPEEVARLGSRFFKYRLAVGFGTLDNFLKFCAECGYTSHMHICKRNPNEPHSPENSYFQKMKPKYVKPKPVERKICQCCEKRTCERNGQLCAEYRKAFVENWNKNIHWVKPEPQDPSKRMAFRYEHPDLVREGIVFEASR